MLPVFILAAFFYEKRIVKTKKALSLKYRVFGIQFFSQNFILAASDAFVVEPYWSSPNRARIDGGDDSAGFQNKGYFTLKLKTANGKNILIDRHSRKADLIKLEELISQT